MYFMLYLPRLWLELFTRLLWPISGWAVGACREFTFITWRGERRRGKVFLSPHANFTFDFYNKFSKPSWIKEKEQLLGFQNVQKERRLFFFQKQLQHCPHLFALRYCILWNVHSWSNLHTCRALHFTWRWIHHNQQIKKERGKPSLYRTSCLLSSLTLDHHVKRLRCAAEASNPCSAMFK